MLPCLNYKHIQISCQILFLVDMVSIGMQSWHKSRYILDTISDRPSRKEKEYNSPGQSTLHGELKSQTMLIIIGIRRPLLPPIFSQEDAP